MNITAAVAFWVALGVLTLALALYRKLLSSSETDVVHLGAGEEKEIPKQLALAARLASIDRWGKVLTVVVVSVGICLGIAYLYFAFNNPESAPALRNLYKQHEPNR
jgi:hypothetical protein